MDSDQIISRLKAVSAPKLSGLSGVSLKTIYRIRSGESSPTIRTVNRLAKHLESLESAVAVKTEGESA
jgi:transcriptional regulator with XRE-family HTH domain